MYRNLEAELKRKDVSREDLAEILGVSISTIYSKLGKKSDFSLNQAIQIKKYLEVEIELSDLFKFDPPEEERAG